ncbi:MAG: DUF5714 domain-containing protein, partial [Dehalococcoidales bacterium]
MNMESVNNCGVCARPLVYATESVTKTCDLCGKEEKTNIYCPSGHYVCDSCHSKAAIEVLKNVLARSKNTDPDEILEQVMAHPSVPMHGPEHHAIVPAAIITAVRNTGYPVPEGAIDKAIERASKVPGGWCGLYGDCGAGVGVGIAVSVLTNATPLTGKERTLALGGTSFALSRMLDSQSRCCKRASRTAVEAAVDYLNDKLRIKLAKTKGIVCTYTVRNQQCARQECPYYPKQTIKQE